MSIQKEDLIIALQSLLKKYRVKYSLISIEEKYSILNKWRSYFASNLNERELPWHSFNTNIHPSFEQTEAISKFNKCYFKDFTIIADFNYYGIRCNSDLVFASFSELKSALLSLENFVDIYITHINYKWTFVITHEEGIGPFFAKHRLY